LLSEDRATPTHNMYSELWTRGYGDRQRDRLTVKLITIYFKPLLEVK